MVASRDEGFDSDYGHIDLVLGKDARREIYPHVSAWLEREDLDRACGQRTPRRSRR